MVISLKNEHNTNRLLWIKTTIRNLTEDQDGSADTCKSFGRLRQEKPNFEVSLHYKTRPCLQNIYTLSKFFFNLNKKTNVRSQWAKRMMLPCLRQLTIWARAEGSTWLLSKVKVLESWLPLHGNTVSFDRSESLVQVVLGISSRPENWYLLALQNKFIVLFIYDNLGWGFLASVL